MYKFIIVSLIILSLAVVSIFAFKPRSSQTKTKLGNKSENQPISAPIPTSAPAKSPEDKLVQLAKDYLAGERVAGIAPFADVKVTVEPQSVAIDNVEYFYDSKTDTFTLPIENTGKPKVTVKHIVLTYQDFPYRADIYIDPVKLRIIDARVGAP